jgi:hypothetical protein
MATQVGNSPIGGTIEKPPIERDKHMVEAGEVSRAAGQRLGKITHVSFMATCEQWERNKNGQRLRNETLEAVSALGDQRSLIERTVW